MKQLQSLDKSSIKQVKEYYINCVTLRNIVTYLKNVIVLNIYASALLQMNAELLYACDPVGGYPLLRNNVIVHHCDTPLTLVPSFHLFDVLM